MAVDVARQDFATYARYEPTLLIEIGPVRLEAR